MVAAIHASVPNLCSLTVGVALVSLTNVAFILVKYSTVSPIALIASCPADALRTLEGRLRKRYYW